MCDFATYIHTYIHTYIQSVVCKCTTFRWDSLRLAPIKKFNLINNYMVSNYNQFCLVLKFVLTINRSTMASYEKIRQFLKFRLVFTSSFQIGTVCFFSQMVLPFYSVCTSVQCIVLTYSSSVDSYDAATTDNGLKNQSYICLASIFAIGRVSLLKDRSLPVTKTALLLLQD